MKGRPLLLGAALLFWGWQTDALVFGASLALILESALLIRVRWDFSDDDFSRIWTLCTVLFLGAAIYAFTDNGGPASFQSYFQHPTVSTQAGAGAVTSRTASAVLRWLPVTLFLFVAAQVFSTRREIPVTTISLFLRRRLKRAEKLGHVITPRGFSTFYPYFTICLLAAGIHPSENKSYFWGLCLLMTWALWLNRTRRFRAVTWVGALALVFVAGYVAQRGIGQVQSYIQELQNLDPEWLSGFMRRRAIDARETATSLGRVGRLKTSGAIVIRLQPREGTPPEYLREASYRFFNPNPGRSRRWRWQATLSGEPLFEQISDKPVHSQIYFLVPGKTNPGRATIACYLDGVSPETGYRLGLLPLPPGSSRIEKIPAYGLKKNNLGAVLAEGPAMVMFDATYGPGPTIDAPFDPSEIVSNSTINPDLFVPRRERAALDKVIAQIPLAGKSTHEKLRVINSFFEQNFTYSMWQDPTNARSTDDPLTQFLLTTHSGHCEYFATATVLLLRRIGIPARYATGYSVHERSGSDYVVRQRDAHAWCLAWNAADHVWEEFDTTPPSWVATEASRASIFEKLSDLGSWLRYEFWRFRLGQSNLRPYLLTALVPALGLSLYQILFRKGRLRHRRDGAKSIVNWPGLDSEFYQVEKRLARAGVGRDANEPLAHWLGRALREPRLADAGESLRELLRLHYRYRFDPNPLTATEREDLRTRARSALAGLRRRKRTNPNPSSSIL